MQKLNNKVDIDIRRFFLWWGRELAFLVPEKLKNFFSDTSGKVIIKVLEESYEISQINDNQAVILLEVERNAQGKSAFDALLEKNEVIKNAEFIVRLTSKNAIKKVIYLPEAAADNVDQVILFELDRYTPFKSDQVYYSIKHMGKDETGLIKVLLILTPRDEMDVIYQELKSWNILPKWVDFEQEPNSFKYGEQSYNLLKDTLREKRVGAENILPWSLGVVTMLLLVSVLAFPVYLLGQQVDLLKAQLKPLTNDILWVENKQSEIDHIYDKTLSLLDKKKNRPSVNELMNTLSGLISNDTWLTHLQLKTGKLQIQGQSPSASVLIGILESSPLFNNARFVSPLTQDKKTGLERFQISVEMSRAKVTEDE